MTDTTILPEPQFSAWYCKDRVSLTNPSGLCNAFTHGPRVPEDPYWIERGCHSEPLYTADQVADTIERLQAEVMEQCRLNGMGSEREAALMGKVGRLQAENANLHDAYCHSQQQFVDSQAE